MVFGKREMMIDFHSHLLIGIDDGSRDLITSAEMLDTFGSQSVSCILCTPHFYGNKERIEDFLARRSTAYGSLRDFIDSSGKDSPALFLAAEVYFFNNMSRAEGLEHLTLEGTDVLFLEMPPDDWRQSYIDEIEELCRKFTVILVHLERYMTSRNRKYIKEVIAMTKSMPLYIQINSRSLYEGRNSRKLIRMFKKGEAHFVGSDCHNMSSRPPDLDRGMKALEEKLGEDFVAQLRAEQRDFLRKKGIHI